MSELEKLNQEMKRFFAPLWPGEDKPLVFGEGNGEAPALMLVGEAPGEQESISGRPFVGKAGKNLDAFLHLAGLERAAIYVTNVVKVRPCEKGPTGRIRNRAPNPEEKALFTPFLMREVSLVRPGMIVTLGNVPLQAFLGKGAMVGACHGQARLAPCGVQVFSLYHPASIIYRPKLREVYVQDVLTLRDMLQDGEKEKKNP
ncbi:MAG: uracil-DNA glycosylase [Clostridiales bacterium]|nr:uracil-DNA glycosylase [Clostridiales bacterium]